MSISDHQTFNPNQNSPDERIAQILIIDDDHQIRRVLREILENANYSVIEACDGQEGLSTCRKETVDLVITDILMPGKEGLETIRELSQERPTLKVIAMSGGFSGYFDVLEIAKKFGVTRALYKPFDNEMLLDTVRDVLGEH